MPTDIEINRSSLLLYTFLIAKVKKQLHLYGKRAETWMLFFAAKICLEPPFFSQH
jgi:hypothetical protein